MTSPDTIIGTFLSFLQEYDFLFIFIILDFFLFPMALLLLKEKKKLYENALLAIPVGIYALFDRFVGTLHKPKSFTKFIAAVFFFFILPILNLIFYWPMVAPLVPSHSNFYFLFLYYLFGFAAWWTLELNISLKKLFV